MAGEAQNLDEIRRRTLDRVDQAHKRFLMVVIAAAVLELALLLAVFYVTDFSDPVHRVVFVCTMLVYLMLCMAVMALGAWFGKVEARILKAIELANR
ncbi:MAG TPA: hypothetical protein VE078_17560 [Thermoanaerobaculia bacterium]|nr:hypothetical protein [Thermoanaerobaculia bacterium]